MGVDNWPSMDQAMANSIGVWQPSRQPNYGGNRHEMQTISLKSVRTEVAYAH